MRLQSIVSWHCCVWKVDEGWGWSASISFMLLLSETLVPHPGGLTIKSFLEYNCFTVLFQFLLHNEVYTCNVYTCVCAQLLQLCPTLCDPMDWQPAHSSVHGILQPTHTGVGCHFLLQGIFLTQGWNLRLLHWQVDSLPLGHQGSPDLAQHKPIIVTLFYH